MAEHTAVLIGCSHPLVDEVAKRLTLRADHVVVLGTDDTRLLQIARTCPDKIETLSLAQHGPSRLAHLREAWGDTPVHSYFDLSPFCTPGEPDATLALNSVSFVATLKAGLRAGQASGAVVFRDAGAGGDHGALGSLMDRIARDLSPANILGLRLRGYDSPQQHSEWADKLMGLPVPVATSRDAEFGWNPNAA